MQDGVGSCKVQLTNTWQPTTTTLGIPVVQHWRFQFEPRNYTSSLHGRRHKRKQNWTLQSCMLLGPPNSCDALRPSPCKCAEPISIQLCSDTQGKWKNMRLRLKKQLKPVQSKASRFNVKTLLYRNTPVQACKFSECSPSCRVLKSCKPWDAKSNR